MRKLSVSALWVTSVSTLLSACGGGSDGGVMGASSASLIGVNANTGANPQVVTLIETTGTETIGTEQNGLSADFDGYAFDADSGFENGAAVEDGNSIGLLTEIDLPTQTDLRLFDGAYDDGTGVIAIYYGISGVELTGDLPSSGSATWTGDGFAELVTGSGTTDFGVGAATVTATFPGTLSATLVGLSGQIDGVTLDSLSITGDRFSGSSVVTSNGGLAVNIVGANAVGNADGIFSGTQTATGVPDEVGGLFTLTGDDATLIGGFVAE